MSPALERQRWMGALALASALPLPFTGIVTVPFLLPYVGVALVLLAGKRVVRQLPDWLENVLAIVIMALVVVAGGLRYGVLRPVAQLAILVAAVRLPGSGQAARMPRTAALVALVATAGIASSTHFTLIPYLTGVAALVIAATGRLVVLSLSQAGGARPERGGVPARVVVTTTVLGCLVAAPLFVLLPRLRSPFAAAPLGSVSVSGFREAIALNRIGEIKESQRIALEVDFPAADRVEPEWLRLAGTTLQHYRGGTWVQGRRNVTALQAGADRTVRLADPPPAVGSERVEIVVEKEGDTLFLPPGATAVELPRAVPVWREPLGSLRIPRGTDPPTALAATFAPGWVSQPPPDDADVRLAPMHAGIRAIAEEMTRGAGSSMAAALSIEEALRDTFRYSATVDVPWRQDPVLWFLRESRAGHCELFASAMVLLLRSLDIPARLQAGYLGGEPGRDGGYVVRDSNAHAWVLAWVEHGGGRGEGSRRAEWLVFDPTPAEGRPAIAAAAAALPFRSRWIDLESLWDRWVLTFSLADQVEIVRQGAAHLRAVAGAAALLGLASLALAASRRAIARLCRATTARLRRGESSHATMQRLLDAADAAGLLSGTAATPRRLAAAIGARHAAVAADLSWAVSAHERHAYSGGTAPPRRRFRRVARTVLTAISRGRPTSGRSGSTGPARQPRGRAGR